MPSEPETKGEPTGDKEINDPLPSPVVSRTSPSSKPKLSPAMIIPIWIFLSSTVILYNNYLYNTLNFKFPVFLVTWHLIFAVSALLSDVSTRGLIQRAVFVLRHVIDYWHTCVTTDDESPRWRERRKHHQRGFYALHPPHWPTLQR